MAYDGEIADDIKAYAITHGLRVTDDQLKYWRDLEAIPYRGEILHPSGVGRTGLYPPGTRKQVVELIKLLNSKRSMSHATWELWKTGCWIGERWTRNRMMACAEEFDCMREMARQHAFTGDQEALSDRLLAWLDRKPRVYNGVIALVRKLCGEQFGTFMFVCLRLAMGHELTFPNKSSAAETKKLPQSEEHNAIITGLGIDRLAKDRVLGAKFEVSHTAVEVLNKNVKTVWRGSIAQKLGTVSTDDMKLAAQEIDVIVRNNRRMFGALSWIYGRHAFGRGHAARAFERFDEENHIRLCMLWAIARKDFIPGINRELAYDADGIYGPLEEKSRELQNFLDAHPALKSIWTPDVIRRALQTSNSEVEQREKMRLVVVKYLISVIRTHYDVW